MKLIVRTLALAGFALLIALGLLLTKAFTGPTKCSLTGAPTRFAAPAAASPNRDLVVRFYTEVILNGQLDRAGSYLRPDYIQHNPDAEQGLAGFVAFFEKINRSLAARGASRKGEITMALAEGDLVTVHTTTVISGKATASFRAIDIFRLQDGMIAEHWDTIQPCDLRSELLMAVSR